MNKDNYFDDDFEVIYDALDELDDYIDLDNSKAESIISNAYEGSDDFEDEYNEYYGEDKEYRNHAKEKSRQKKPHKKRGDSSGKAVYRIIQTILKMASLILITAITALLVVNFWNGHSPFGTPAQAIAEKNYALGAYAGVAVFLILCEVIAFFWTLSGQKIQEGRRVRKLDTGRGMCSFLFMYAGSYMSNLLGHMIPESPAALSGLKGAIAIYGSLNDTLLLLCAAGIISCLIRKFIFH